MTRVRPAADRQRLPRVNWRTGGQQRKLALKMAKSRLYFEKHRKGWGKWILALPHQRNCIAL